MSDITVLDYARHYGLSTKHNTTPPLNALKTFLQDHVASLKNLEPENGDFYLEDEICNLIASHERVPHEDKFKLNVAESRLLASVISQPDTTGSKITHKIWESVLPDHRRVRNLKLPEPLLRTGGGDVNKDSRKVKLGINPVTILDDIRYEWNEKYMREHSTVRSNEYDNLEDMELASQEVQQKLGFERLQMSREAIIILAQVMNSGGSEHHVYADDLSSSNPRIRSTWHVPQILDISSFDDDETTDDEAVGVLGDCQNSIIRQPYCADSMDSIIDVCENQSDVKRLPDVHKAVQNPQSTAGYSYDEGESKQVQFEQTTSRCSIRNERSCTEQPTHKRRKLCHSKLSDVKETPSRSSKTMCHKILCNKAEKVFDVTETTQGFLKPEPEESTHSSQDQDACVLADKTLLRCSERREMDNLTMTYMTPPELQQYTSSSPWMLQQDLVRKYVTDDIGLLDDNLTDQLSLDWVPFRSGPYDALGSERLASTSQYLRSAITLSDQIIHSSQLLWKEPGLRLLDVDVNDIEYVDVDSDIEVENGPPTRVKFNGLHVADVTADKIHFSVDAAVKTNSKISREEKELAEGQLATSRCNKQKQTHQRIMDKQYLKHDLRYDTILNFSATNPLSRFLHLREKCTKTNLIDARYIANPQYWEEDEVAQSDQVPGEEIMTSNPELHTDGEAAEADDVSTLLDPATRRLDSARTIFVNSSLLQSHSALIRHLENTAENKLTIMYRDFNATTEDAVDIVLNPVTCVIVANLQTLMQRPLPGQGSRNSGSIIHLALKKASKTFEVVFVFVTYHSTSSKLVLTNQEVAMANFTAFCSWQSAATTSVRPIWLPHNDKLTLHRTINMWTWHLVSQHALKTDSVPNTTFIQEETLWELFLRKAGINAMAAQIVLGQLQRPDSNSTLPKKGQDDQDQDHIVWGLRRFVRMSTVERLEIFQRILGSSVVEKISLVIDQRASIQK